MNTLTLKWLRQNVLSYPQKDRVFADTDALLTRVSTLRPKSDVYSSVLQHLPLLDLTLLQRTMTVAHSFFYASMACSPYRFAWHHTTSL
jgi:hypothetical protein